MIFTGVQMLTCNGWIVYLFLRPQVFRKLLKNKKMLILFNDFCNYAHYQNHCLPGLTFFILTIKCAT